MPGAPLLSIATNEFVDRFPSPENALDEPDGLLAAGGDLTEPTLLEAYRNGIFPWYSDGQPILWWCPSRRAVLSPGEVKISRSLRKTLNRKSFELSHDRAFGEVVRACAAPRAKRNETWITEDMYRAYVGLFDHGHAHSIECWHEHKLVGGLYGVAIGRVFFGESMFSSMTDASKVALVHLSNQLKMWEYALIDCQIDNPHLTSMGAGLVLREQFLSELVTLTRQAPRHDAWS